MMHQKAAFREPFAARGIDVTRLFYFGESVLLPEYRGHGIGHAFFDAREAAARRAGASAACFAAVVRAPDHPRGLPVIARSTISGTSGAMPSSRA
jgi:GNAT superfamily N-acetyltransferase